LIKLKRKQKPKNKGGLDGNYTPPILFSWKNVDSKSDLDRLSLPTHARVRMDPSESGDPDADWDRKTKRGERSDGTLWEKLSKWFGYKLHLLIDSHYELPLADRIPWNWFRWSKI